MITIDDVKKDIQLVDDFIVQERKLVTSIVNRHFPTVRDSEDYEDILQIATIGLYKAIEKFDTSSGNKFSTFAVIKIIGAVRNHFRADSNGCLSTTNEMRVHWRKYLYLSASLGYKDYEVADELGVTIEYIEELKQIMRSVIKYEDLKNDKNGEDIGGIEELAVSPYNLEKECMYHIEFEDKIDMLRELLPKKYIKALTLRLKGLSYIDISKKLKCTPVASGVMIERIQRTIIECVNPYYNGQIRFIELKNRMNDILQMESRILVGGDEVSTTFDACVDTVKKWAITNPGQSIRLKPILEEAGYVINGEIKMQEVKNVVIAELKKEGYKVLKNGSAYWVDEESIEPKEVEDKGGSSVTADEMQMMLTDLVQGMDINFFKLRELIKQGREVADDTKYDLAIRNKIVSTEKLALIHDTLRNLSSLASDNDKRIEITLLVKEVD